MKSDKIMATFSISREVYTKFRDFCNEKGYIMSKHIEKMMKELYSK